MQGFELGLVRNARVICRSGPSRFGLARGVGSEATTAGRAARESGLSWALFGSRDSA